MDYTLIGPKNIFCFLSDILFVSKGCEEDHFKFVTDIPKNLDADNLFKNLPKCHFAMPENLRVRLQHNSIS